MKPRGGEGQNGRLKCPMGFLVPIAFNIILGNLYNSKIALFTVTFSHLHYNVFDRGCEAISGNFAVSARNCLTFTFKCIVMQMRKGNCEKGYYDKVKKIVIGSVLSRNFNVTL